MKLLILCCFLGMPTVLLAQSLAPPEDSERAQPEPSCDRWQDVDPAVVKKILEDALADQSNSKAKQLRESLGVPSGSVTVKKNFPPEPNDPNLSDAAPYLVIIFDSLDERAGDPNAQKMARSFVKDVLSQVYFTTKFTDMLDKNGMKSDDGWIKESYLRVDAGVIPEGPPSPFDVPRGLSMPHTELLWRLGYRPYANSEVSFAYVPRVCHEMATRAIRLHLYSDAVALANHGLRYYTEGDSILLYLRAYAEIRQGKHTEALDTVRELKALGPIPSVMVERLNGRVAIEIFKVYGKL